MKLYKFSAIIFLISLLAVFSACEDETTTIGSSIASGEVSITVDTFLFNLEAKSRLIENFDSKTGNLMIGNIQTEEYGALSCSFVARLMCSPNLQVADSLLLPERVDSCKLILGAQRDEIIGDSLAPQRLAVYLLDKQLPSDITNTFDPEGYYNPANPLASRSYTVSGIGLSDSAFYNNTFVELTVDLPRSFGMEVFEKYKNEPQIFEWPSIMAKDFIPGIYAKSTFGKGCIANITSVYIGIFYHSLEETTIINDNDTIVKQEHVNNVVFPFTVSPEVLSSNNIKYIPSEKIINQNANSDGKIVVTTPGGFICDFIFPAQTLIDEYKKMNTHLSTINELNLMIPAEAFDDTSGISVAQNMLMVKTTEYESFFKENKIPDNLTSFTGVYDATNKRFYFSSMRNYFIELLNKEQITQEDLEFTLVPVELSTETVSNSYYGEGSTYVTKCVPLTSRPTMSLLNTKEAMVTFSFSTQMIK